MCLPLQDRAVDLGSITLHPGIIALQGTVGYCASLEESFCTTLLHFRLGYSHNLRYQLPENIPVRAFILCEFGIDRNQVSQLGSKI